MGASKQNIGGKLTFWSLISGQESKNIVIPPIQRDYTYGSQTAETDKVLNNMLEPVGGINSLKNVRK